MRAGRLALMSPVMTSTDGRCVARIRWMPTARAIWASRQIDSSTSLLATIIRSASSSMRTMMHGMGLDFEAVLVDERPLALGHRRLDVAVVLLEVAHADGRERLVALFHLAHRPPQGVRGQLGIDHDRRQQVRDLFVHPELETLGVDHDQPDVLRCRPEEDAREHGVHAHGLARAGRAGDEQVRHGRQVADERLAVDRLAEREREARGRAAVGLRLEQLAHRNLLAVRVRNLDADGGLAGNTVDEDRLCLHGQAQVIGEPGDLAVLHAGVGLELVGRDDRARVDLHHVPLDGELAALLLELPGAVHELSLVDLLLGLGRIEQGERWRCIRAVAFLLRRDLLRVRQRQRRLHQRRRRPLDRWRSGA